MCLVHLYLIVCFVWLPVPCELFPCSMIQTVHPFCFVCRSIEIHFFGWSVVFLIGDMNFFHASCFRLFVLSALHADQLKFIALVGVWCFSLVTSTVTTFFHSIWYASCATATILFFTTFKIIMGAGLTWWLYNVVSRRATFASLNLDCCVTLLCLWLLWDVFGCCSRCCYASVMTLCPSG